MWLNPYKNVVVFGKNLTTLIILLLLISTTTHLNSTPFTWRERCFWTSETLKIILDLKFCAKANCCFYNKEHIKCLLKKRPKLHCALFSSKPCKDGFALLKRGRQLPLRYRKNNMKTVGLKRDEQNRDLSSFPSVRRSAIFAKKP